MIIITKISQQMVLDLWYEIINNSKYLNNWKEFIKILYKYDQSKFIAKLVASLDKNQLMNLYKDLQEAKYKYFNN